jgi:hypothetical protein
VGPTLREYIFQNGCISGMDVFSEFMDELCNHVFPEFIEYEFYIYID